MTLKSHPRLLIKQNIPPDTTPEVSIACIKPKRQECWVVENQLLNLSNDFKHLVQGHSRKGTQTYKT